MHVNRIEDVIPPGQLLDELRHLSASPEPWFRMVPLEYPTFRCEITAKLPPLIRRLSSESRDTQNGHELAGLLAISRWIKHPVVIRPTQEQAESLKETSIDLELTDYEQPFEAVLVETPGCGDFYGCLCYKAEPEVMVTHLMSRNPLDWIVTPIRHREGVKLERAVSTLYDESLTDLLVQSRHAQRLALNLCLCLVNFGHKTEPLLPKQLRDDRELSKRNDDKGERARLRVKESLMRCDFKEPIIIRRATEKGSEDTDTGRHVKSHWVRGHWKMQPHGPGMSLRRKTLIRPYLTHAQEYQPTGAVTPYQDRR